MPKKVKANAFSDEWCEWLDDRTRFGDNVKWIANYRLAPNGRDFVDVVGILKNQKDPSIPIEVELHREDPVSNVVKILKWALEEGKRKIGSHSSVFQTLQGSEGREKEASPLIGWIFKRECASQYIPLHLKYSPWPGGRYGGGRRTKAAELLARRIMQWTLKLELVAHR